MISHCTHETVLHVARNMRAADKEEIYATRFEENPFLLTHDVMQFRSFSWVLWWNEKPCAVGGAGELWPGTFTMFMFATDDFPRIGLMATRFAKRTVIPTLFRDCNARRLQAHSHQNHGVAHKWLETLGFQREAVCSGYGRDGADFYQYALRRIDKPDISC
jgi:hypothetical protein